MATTELSQPSQRALNNLYALAGRYKHDPEFSASIKADPSGALLIAGLQNQLADVEQLMKESPADFERAARALIDTLGTDFWAMTGVISTTCDTPGKPVPNLA